MSTTRGRPEEIPMRVLHIASGLFVCALFICAPSNTAIANASTQTIPHAAENTLTLSSSAKKCGRIFPRRYLNSIFDFSRRFRPANGLRQGNAGRGDNSGEPQNLGILLPDQRRDGEARVLQEFYLAQQTILAQLVERNLPGQALEGPQVDYQILGFRIVRIGIRIARHFGNRVERVLGFAVVAKRAVAAAHLLELPQRVGLVAGVPPHLLPFYEKSVPVIDARVNGQQPLMRSGDRTSHGLAVTGELYMDVREKQ